MKTMAAVACAALFPLGFVALLKASVSYGFRAAVSEGNEIVGEIYKYKEENGFFPDAKFRTISGRKKTEFYYSRADDGSFILWTQGFSVGESIEYDSKTGGWRRAG